MKVHWRERDTVGEGVIAIDMAKAQPGLPAHACKAALRQENFKLKAADRHHM